MESKPRSVKRKLDEFDNGDDVAARVEVNDEVNALREALAGQQETIQDLILELDKERNASSTAASEAMAMILRLQREKAEIQMEFRQFKRFSEEKMVHDHQELVALDDLLYKREQTIESLSREIKSCKNVDLKGYPSLKCITLSDDYGESGVENYSPKTLESRIFEMEVGKNMVMGPEEEEIEYDGDKEEGISGDLGVMAAGVGSDLGMVRDLKEEFEEEVVGPDSGIARNLEDEFEGVGGDYHSEEEDENARVYTIDAIHDVSISREQGDEDKAEDIKKLYMRLQALEADRESMRQAIILMRTEKAQLVLLKEIAQQLCKEAVPERREVAKRPCLIANFSFAALIKWVLRFIFWRKKASQSKYSFGLSKNNVGLLLLLDKSPRVNRWRCLATT